MILSMTGFGSAAHSHDGVSYNLEIRSVNSRYFKAVIKLPETVQFAESEVERMLRERLARGTVAYTLRIRSDADSAGFEVNLAALNRYVEQFCQARIPQGVRATIDLAAVAGLPGVCQPAEVDEQAREHLLQLVRQVTDQAITGLVEMRRAEGQALRQDLLGSCQELRRHLAAVAAQAPKVVQEYQQRLSARVQILLDGATLNLEQDALRREVAVFAERCDVSEELARLGSHLVQFVELCDSAEPAGRRLDFLAQEMLREANTVGSKSNDAGIARSVVEMKSLIDRLKEQVMNVA